MPATGIQIDIRPDAEPLSNDVIGNEQHNIIRLSRKGLTLEFDNNMQHRKAELVVFNLVDTDLMSPTPESTRWKIESIDKGGKLSTYVFSTDPRHSTHMSNGLQAEITRGLVRELHPIIGDKCVCYASDCGFSFRRARPSNGAGLLAEEIVFVLDVVDRVIESYFDEFVG